MRTITSKNELLINELSENVFKRFGVDPTISKNDANEIALAWKDTFTNSANLEGQELEIAKASHAMSLKVIETCLMHRKEEGLLADANVAISQELTVGCAYCVVNSPKDAESFVSRVLNKVDI
jgi:hypothetical protein